MWVPSLGHKDTLGEDMAIHLCILAWKTPWAEEPDRLEFKQLQRDGQDWMTEHTRMLIKLEKFTFSLSLSLFFLGTYCMLSDDNEGNV